MHPSIYFGIYLPLSPILSKKSLTPTNRSDLMFFSYWQGKLNYCINTTHSSVHRSVWYSRISDLYPNNICFLSFRKCQIWLLVLSNDKNSDFMFSEQDVLLSSNLLLHVHSFFLAIISLFLLSVVILYIFRMMTLSLRRIVMRKERENVYDDGVVNRRKKKWKHLQR